MQDQEQVPAVDHRPLAARRRAEPLFELFWNSPRVGNERSHRGEASPKGFSESTQWPRTRRNESIDQLDGLFQAIDSDDVGRAAALLK